MNVKKVICAVLLGIGNILLFSILPFLMTGLVAYILNFLLEFIFGNIMSIFATIVFIPCVVLTSIIVYKLASHSLSYFIKPFTLILKISRSGNRPF